MVKSKRSLNNAFVGASHPGRRRESGAPPTST